jgi:hypothetical protein
MPRIDRRCADAILRIAELHPAPQAMPVAEGVRRISPIHAVDRKASALHAFTP